MECALCRRVAKALSPDTGRGVLTCYNEEEERFIHLGSWGELKENRLCLTCSQIVHIFHAKFEKADNAIDYPELQFWLYDLSNKHFRLILEEQEKGNLASHQFVIQPLEVGSSERCGTLLDPVWLDLEQVLGWLRTCDSTHGECRNRTSRPSLKSPVHNMILISIPEQRLVDATGGEKYVALSYVWGTEQSPFQATRSNVEDLKIKGALATAHIQDRLPGTIRRALQFSALLDVDFVWIDRLCIVQDDPIHATTQVNSMGTIFSNSYVTLCADDGDDASTGLRGIKQCSEPRDVQQEVLTFYDGESATQWVKQIDFNQSEYASRGWVFQEQVLSQRKLSFTVRGLRWTCQTLEWEESNFQAEEDSHEFTEQSLDLGDTLWPCLRKWDSLLDEYLSRKLTYKADILRAFSGVNELLATSAIGDFHYGLPERFFDIALLWVPRTPLTRRRAENDCLEAPMFPSWSWAGWEGAFSTQIDTFWLNHERSNSFRSFCPLVGGIYPSTTWFKVVLGTMDMEPISNDYAKFQNCEKEDQTILPPGWSSHQEDGSDVRYWTYCNAPSSSTFWYPVPTSTMTEKKATPQWSQVLYFKTSRSYLNLGRPLSELNFDRRGTPQYVPIYSLVTPDNNFAGVLHAHAAQEIRADVSQRCELIKISAGYAMEDAVTPAFILEFKVPERLRSSDTYEFFHVLWIKWYGDVAERQGLGRVEQSIWNSLPQDEIELYLR